MQVNKIKSKRKLGLFASILIVIIVTSAFSISSTLAVKAPAAPLTLDPLTIPKYENQLVVPPVYQDSMATPTYTVSMVETTQQVLPPSMTASLMAAGGTGTTKVWGYQGDAIVKGGTLSGLGYNDGDLWTNFVWSPSATFEATTGTPITVKWINDITTPQPFAVDPTLNWANPTNAFPEGDVFSATGGPFQAFPPGYDGTVTANNPQGLNAQSPVPLVPHLHGAEVSSYYDGGPDAWWTSTGLKGAHYATASATDANAAIYEYTNAQEPNTLWYHDHALGITRINVMSGLAGFYMLRDDPAVPATLPLTPANFDEYMTQTFLYGVSEIPIAIQDRTFLPNGEIYFPAAGINPKIHPYWTPEFFGDTIMVNGMVWPNLDVTPGWYRLRLLDGSNARFYTLSFSNGMPFTVIGADGGYLQQPVSTNTITIAPGERSDVLVYFTPGMVGSQIILTNTANAPFPVGIPADPATTGQIMQFTVKSTTDPTWINGVEGVPTIAEFPTTGLNPTLPTFPTLTAPPVTTRYITLVEVMGPKGPIMVLINGQYYNAPVTETPTVGTEEEWVIINLTADTHPIHTHLVTSQLISRQTFTATGVSKYTHDWLKLQRDPVLKTNYSPPFPRNWNPVTLDPTPYLSGVTTAALPIEVGWKDTIQMHPGEVTTIRVRFTSQDGSPFSAVFDPTLGPGYVYHCHILDHEDNEMMRPFTVLPVLP